MPNILRFPPRHRAPALPYALPPHVPTSVQADRLSVALAQAGHLSWAAEAAQIAADLRRMERTLNEAVQNAREEAVAAERASRGVPVRLGPWPAE